MKLKICSLCDKPTEKLWKSNPAVGMCCSRRYAALQAISKSKEGGYKQVTLSQSSDGQKAKAIRVYETKRIKSEPTYYQKQLIAYRALNKAWLKEHRLCEAGLEGCLGVANQVHHKKGRNGFLNDTTTWLAVCGPCHQQIELHPAWAMALGFCQSRLAKTLH